MYGIHSKTVCTGQRESLLVQYILKFVNNCMVWKFKFPNERSFAPVLKGVLTIPVGERGEHDQVTKATRRRKKRNVFLFFCTRREKLQLPLNSFFSVCVAIATRMWGMEVILDAWRGKSVARRRGSLIRMQIVFQLYDTVLRTSIVCASAMCIFIARNSREHKSSKYFQLSWYPPPKKTFFYAS